MRFSGRSVDRGIGDPEWLIPGYRYQVFDDKQQYFNNLGFRC
jgi:hypothetical protein